MDTLGKDPQSTQEKNHGHTGEGPTIHQESAKNQIMVTQVKEPQSTKKQTHSYTVEEPTFHPRNMPRSGWGRTQNPTDSKSHWCKVTVWKVWQGKPSHGGDHLWKKQAMGIRTCEVLGFWNRVAYSDLEIMQTEMAEAML